MTRFTTRHPARLASVCAVTMLAALGGAKADACRETFVKALINPPQKGAHKSHISTVAAGQKPMLNIHYGAANGDWMSEMIDPPTMPWSLAVGKVLYASYDKGKSWKKMRDLNDPGHSPDAARKQAEETASTVANAVCDAEEIDGRPHDRIAADLAYPGMNATVRQTLWLDRETRKVRRAHQIIRASGFETVMTENIEYLKELTLPKP